MPLTHILLLNLSSPSNPNPNTISSKRLFWISDWELISPSPFSHCRLFVH